MSAITAQTAESLLPSPLGPGAHRSLPTRRAGPAREGTPWKPGAARRACARGSETVPRLAREQAESARSAPHDRSGLARHHREIGQASERESGSRSRIREGGWRSAVPARVARAAPGPPSRGERARPSYPDRSPVFAVVLQFLQKIPERHDGLTRWRAGGGQCGRCDPSSTHGLGQHGIGQEWAAPPPGWDQLCDHAIPIRDEDGLPASGQANVLAELVLEDFQANRTHDCMVASRSYLCQPILMRGGLNDELTG